jgi:hypothetical protein
VESEKDVVGRVEEVKERQGGTAKSMEKVFHHAGQSTYVLSSFIVSNFIIPFQFQSHRGSLAMHQSPVCHIDFTFVSTDQYADEAAVLAVLYTRAEVR